MPSFSIYNLVTQYNTPSNYNKTFENKLNWKNLTAKTVLALAGRWKYSF